LALREYDSNGVLSRTRWLVEHAVQSDTRFIAGSFVVAYAYVSAVDGSLDPPKPEYRAGVARFDVEGNLLWNQSEAFAAPLSFGQVQLVGSDSTGAVYLLANVEPKTGSNLASALVRVASSGQVAWTREARWLEFSAVGSSGTWFSVESFSGVTRFDSSGGALWTASLQVAPYTAAVDAHDGLVLVSDYPAPRLDVMSSDGSVCKQHLLPRHPCVQKPNGESYCADTRLLPLERDRFLLVGTTSVSRLSIPGGP
jgi:hypothetical protein